MTKHLLTAEAYERKASMGGGFRGVVYNRTTKTKEQSGICGTIDEARNWAKRRVFEIMGDQTWLPGYVYKPNWRMNVWGEG